MLKRVLISIFRRIVRPLSPVYRYCKYNDCLVDVPVKYCHLPFEPGSVYRPLMIQDIPDYENALCQGLQQSVNEGDHVVIVGGGFGVTTVHAARQTGRHGRVTSFEASKERSSCLEWGIKVNGKEKNAKVVHALVGAEVKVDGEIADATQIMPKELPSCDVLELDCEGAEREILQKIEQRPRVILVETHGFRGAPTQTVRKQLVNMGYTVDDLGVAEPRKTEFCLENDIRVLLAVQR
jgi:hypothetical protein